MEVHTGAAFSIIFWKHTNNYCCQVSYRKVTLVLHWKTRQNLWELRQLKLIMKCKTCHQRYWLIVKKDAVCWVVIG